MSTRLSHAGLPALTLAVLSGCATRGSHSAPPASLPTPTPPPPAAPAPAPAPDVTPQLAPPPEPAAPPEPAPPPRTMAEQAPASAGSPLPPCPPVHKPHRRHKTRPKEPQGPEPPSPARPPAEVDAQVGEVGASLTSILGKNVESPKGENLGRVVDVLADAEGHVRVAIIDFGGFLGVGTRRIAVDWPLLRFNPKARDKSLVLSVTREKLQSAPEYKDSTSPRVLMPPPAEAPQNAADTGDAKK
jgi:PRC-barrel domain